jgi:hypothetical protein
MAKCPRCGCEISQDSINCPECAKPLATCPLILEKTGFNFMWILYGGCGCLFLIFLICILLIITGILVIPS